MELLTSDLFKTGKVSNYDRLGSNWYLCWVIFGFAIGRLRQNL